MTKQKLLKAQRILEINQVDASDESGTIQFLIQNDFSKKEAEAFLERISDPDAIPIFDPKNPNASIDINVDYNRLHLKEEFEKYNDLLEDLSPTIGHSYGTELLFEFELFRMLPVRNERYPGLPGSPIDFIGVRFKESEPKPVMKTRITISQARECNQQILNAHSIAGYGKYYLLKKVK